MARRRVKKHFLFISLLFISACFEESLSYAEELKMFYRSARQIGMGGAFVGLADDETTLFTNPAGLAGIEKPRIHYAVLDVEASNDVIFGSSDLASAFGDFSIDTVNELLGKNIYLHGQFTPSVVIPNFGFGLMVDGQVAFYGKNQALPQLQIGYQTTTGMILGWGTSLTRVRRTRQHGPDLKIGVAAKTMWRRGGYQTFSPSELTDLIDGASGRELLSRIGGDWGFGLGIDAGTHLSIPAGKSVVVGIGTAVTDIGNTNFTGSAQQIPSNWTVGASIKLKMGAAVLNLAYDYSHIMDVTDWRQKSHLGMEFDLPIIDLYLGLNQIYITYGFGFDIWIMRLYALSYASEMGTIMGQDPDRRYLLRLDFKFDL